MVLDGEPRFAAVMYDLLKGEQERTEEKKWLSVSPPHTYIQCANKEKSDSGRDFEIGRPFEKRSHGRSLEVARALGPPLRLQYSSKGEGSTSNNLGFCNLHTPWSVSKWVEFDSLIQVEALKDESSIVLNADVEEKVSHIKRQK